jgi:hypothetical protein
VFVLQVWFRRIAVRWQHQSATGAGARIFVGRFTAALEAPLFHGAAGIEALAEKQVPRDRAARNDKSFFAVASGNKKRGLEGPRFVFPTLSSVYHKVMALSVRFAANIFAVE